MRKIFLVVISLLLCATSFGAAKKRVVIEQPLSDREYSAAMLYKIAKPVLKNLAEGTLKENLLVQKLDATDPIFKEYGDRTAFAPLEAIGRTFCGVAPWLELPIDSTSAEGRMRIELRDYALKGLKHVADSSALYFVNFSSGSQILVDAAFLAQGLLRAPKNLWGSLDTLSQQRLIDVMVKTRNIRPGRNNWLLFSATVEAFLCSVGAPYDQMRIDYAVHQHEAWYKGDGAYGDGKDFHWDYYNSFVIQPMLVDIVQVMPKKYGALSQTILTRSTRYAEVLERMISPEGTIPVMGRSLQYRMGAIQSLSQMALLDMLPKSVSKGQVRAATTALIKRFMDQPQTFSEDGWLMVGFCGHQPRSAEGYCNSGSLYLCTAGMLTLGLPENHPFWTEEAQPWTSKKAWSGAAFDLDHAISK